MAKKVDTAGMWMIKGNPITHDGVAMYSGRAIDANGSLGLDPQKLYPVLRPREELIKACESFNGKPLINDHEMIGTEGELRKPDEKNIGGTIYNVRPSADTEGYIVADMTIFSQELQDAIQNGKCELSLGYWCKYRPEVGTYNGRRYEFVQYDLEGNHIALVDCGRMGSGVRVFDNKEKTLVFDSMEITEMNKQKKTKTADANELREEIAGLLKEASDEMLEKCKDLLSKKGGKDDGDDPDNKNKGGDNNEPDDKTKKTGDNEPDDKGGKKSGEGDEDPDNKKNKSGEDDDDDDKKGKGEDHAPTMKEMLAEFSKREGLYKAVEPHIGSFDHAEMTAKEIAVYAANKMGIATADGAEVACVENYLKGLGHGVKTAKKSVSSATDSSEEEAPSTAFNKFIGE